MDRQNLLRFLYKTKDEGIRSKALTTVLDKLPEVSYTALPRRMTYKVMKQLLTADTDAIWPYVEGMDNLHEFPDPRLCRNAEDALHGTLRDMNGVFGGFAHADVLILVQMQTQPIMLLLDDWSVAGWRVHNTRNIPRHAVLSLRVYPISKSQHRIWHIDFDMMEDD